MGGYKKQARTSDQSSIKCRCNPVEGASFELADFVSKEDALALADNSKQTNKKAEPKSPMILSTAQLIAAVGQLWDSANRLAIFHPKGNLIDSHSECKKEVLRNLDKEENAWVPLSTDSKYFCVDVSSAGQFSPMVQPNLEFLKVTQKMSVFDSCSKKFAHSTFWTFLRSGASLSNDTGVWGLASAGIPYQLGNVHRWMTEKFPAGFTYADSIPDSEKREAGEQCILGDTTGCAGASISGDTLSPASKPATEDNNKSDLSKSKGQSSCFNAKLMMSTRTTKSLLSDYFLKDVSDMKEDCDVTRQPCSSLCADYCINSVASSNGTCEKCRHLMDDDALLENKRNQSDKNVVEDENKMEFHSPKAEKPHLSLAKQEHAFAGALAGVFVSLCLHPVDTVKTVIQSCHTEQKSIVYIGRSIVSERGLTGLYRGIASNIASSAPISAVYAFTYESVKGALLPHLPKEFHSLAHCTAGGCASVATSFIFTPSERIKQQMQVGSRYHNCWNALVGIIKNGGLHSLYAGWGAVLCRNVPHSIVKFYTYESLKQMMLPSLKPGAQPNTIETLICGGVAGSTAALFTTPFDVVKTRLQTQIPGSTSQYSSVYHALQEIGKREGLKGLYRGLIPRLVMYMSQGALFFASYEFFKGVFSLEVPHLSTLRIQHKQTEEDDVVSTESLFPSTSPAPPGASPSQPRLRHPYS